MLYHYGHELNSQIFLTIYLCTRFFATRNFAHLFRKCVVSLLSKINVQIILTQTIVMQKNFDPKNDIANIKPQKFCGLIFATTNFVSKNFAQSFFV